MRLICKNIFGWLRFNAFRLLQASLDGSALNDGHARCPNHLYYRKARFLKEGSKLRFGSLSAAGQDHHQHVHQSRCGVQWRVTTQLRRTTAYHLSGWQALGPPGCQQGWFAMFAAMDRTASSHRTRALLGWEPKQPGLIADLDQPSYFE
jgi:hypothetical protein